MSDTRFYTGRGGSDPRAADALPTVDPKAMRAPDFYRATAQTAAAVDVALTLGMPLLLTGEPGSGKSGLADSIAWELGLGEVLRFPVKSGTESRDLFYRFFCFTDLTMAQALRIDPTWHPLIKGCPPRWVSEWGEDRHGVFVAFTLADITQRLRWIPAGAFRMGSPEDKPGRLDNEGPQHTVYIRRGFWRFDTPCTQGLWETVMDENPSRFQSPDRPVERVSWNDVQGFLEHINARIPGLELVLPTEAEGSTPAELGPTRRSTPIPSTCSARTTLRRSIPSPGTGATAAWISSWRRGRTPRIGRRCSIRTPHPVPIPSAGNARTPGVCAT